MHVTYVAERLFSVKIENSEHFQNTITYLNFFEQGNVKRPDILQKIFNALHSIPPSSVDSERAFSSLGLFATKIRSRLNDQSINALTIVREYYKNK